VDSVEIAGCFAREPTVAILPLLQRLTVEIVLMVQELEGAMPLVNRLAGERFTELKGKFFKRLPRRLDNLEAALEVRSISKLKKAKTIESLETILLR